MISLFGSRSNASPEPAASVRRWRRRASRLAGTPAAVSPAALAALAALAIVAIATPAAAAAGELADIGARGKLVMLTYPVQGTHFVSVNLDAMREQGLKLGDIKRPDQFQGIDVELMKGFAATLKVPLEIHAIVGGYGALVPALLEYRGDLVASEFTITPARRAKVAFTTPYVSNWVAVVVPRRSMIASPTDLAGKRGAVLKGSSHIEFLKESAPSALAVPTGFDLESLDAVSTGRVDFALMDTSAAAGEPVDKLHADLKVGFRLTEIGDGIAVRPGSDLLAALNAYLAAVKQSGELQRILERNGFTGTTPTAAPRAPRANTGGANAP